MDETATSCPGNAGLNDNCIGMYCGRVNLSNLMDGAECFSSCQSCPTGFRVNNESLCQPCDEPVTARGYLYFSFMCLVVLLMRYTVTTLCNQKGIRSLWIIPLYIIPLIEVSIAVLLTLISLPPKGLLVLHSCSVESINDFYPIFFNPSLNYVDQVQCTYEVVYPLYSMVFIFFGFNFILHLPLLAAVLVLTHFSSVRKHGLNWSRNIEYLWLIFYPVLILVYSILAGGIYYSFDYLTIISSLGLFAVLSTVLTSIKQGDFKNSFKVYTFPVQWVLVFGAMVSLSCGILSLTEWSNIAWRAPFISLVLLLPILHPFFTLFASPQLQFQSWNVDKLANSFHY